LDDCRGGRSTPAEAEWHIFSIGESSSGKRSINPHGLKERRITFSNDARWLTYAK